LRTFGSLGDFTFSSVFLVEGFESCSRFDARTVLLN
jgi:hypothetical protein